MPVILNRGDFSLQGTSCLCLGNFWLQQTGGEDTISIEWTEARDAAVHPTEHRTAPPHRIIVQPKCYWYHNWETSSSWSRLPPDNHTVNRLFSFQSYSNATFFIRLIWTSTMTTSISPPMTLQSLSLCSPFPWFHSTKHLLTSNKTRLFIMCIVYCQSARMFLFCSLIYPKYGV